MGRGAKSLNNELRRVSARVKDSRDQLPTLGQASQLHGSITLTHSTSGIHSSKALRSPALKRTMIHVATFIFDRSDLPGSSANG